MTGLDALRPSEPRFWSKVKADTPEGCWEWQRAKNRHGYGIYGLYGTKTRLAHRHAWTVVMGPIPNGLHVLHRCDNPPCVNPAHLFVGTHLDNMADMLVKGRNALGEKYRRSSLTADKVREIRERAANGELHERLAKESGVCRPAVTMIVNRTRWAWVR